MTGGGASIISLPVFLWLGMPFAMALTIQKVSAVFWTIPATYNYLKDRKINWTFLFTFALIGLVGAYLGVVFVLNLNQQVVKIIIGILVLLLVAYTYFKKDLGLKEKKVRSKLRQFMAYPFALILGFYESILGAGNGIMFSVISFHTRGFDFIDALGSYYAIAFIWDLLAVFLLIEKGFYDFSLMIPAILGSMLGGYVGSKYGKYRGNKFIKNLFVLIGGVLGIKLLLGF